MKSLNRKQLVFGLGAGAAVALGIYHLARAVRRNTNYTTFQKSPGRKLIQELPKSFSQMEIEMRDLQLDSPTSVEDQSTSMSVSVAPTQSEISVGPESDLQEPSSVEEETQYSKEFEERERDVETSKTAIILSRIQLNLANEEEIPELELFSDVGDGYEFRQLNAVEFFSDFGTSQCESAGNNSTDFISTDPSIENCNARSQMASASESETQASLQKFPVFETPLSDSEAEGMEQDPHLVCEDCELNLVEELDNFGSAQDTDSMKNTRNLIKFVLGKSIDNFNGTQVLLFRDAFQTRKELGGIDKCILCRASLRSFSDDNVGVITV